MSEINKVKIGVWVLSEYKPQTGGGFALYDKLIHLIDEHTFPEDIEICFVGHKSAANFSFKKEYISVYALPFNFSFLSGFVTKISHKSGYIGRREGNILKRQHVDLIYYPVQGFKKVNNFPFVSANWDIGHLSTFALPEFALNGRFEYKSKWYSGEIYKALMVLAESESGKNELIRYTQLNPDRIGIVPLISGGITEMEVTENAMNEYLLKHHLIQEKFFFYPAQYWAHKNHYNLLLAFSELIKEFPEMKLVLTGSDKGNKGYIKETVARLGMEQHVVITGFISNECLYTFYRNALALVFPGLLGPTNMPVLEAGMLNCPVLCSNLEGHKEIMKDGARYFDGLDVSSIYASMKFILNDENRNAQKMRAAKVMNESKFTSEHVLQSLTENFRKVKIIRRSWGESGKIF